MDNLNADLLNKNSRRVHSDDTQNIIKDTKTLNSVDVS